jgi:hypothetical protein
VLKLGRHGGHRESGFGCGYAALEHQFQTSSFFAKNFCDRRLAEDGGNWRFAIVDAGPELGL